jgi:predicted enzyme related to lactoylglutathione lyase
MASLIALVSNIEAQVITGKPDNCMKNVKEGKPCPYCVLEPLKAGALSFKLGYVSLYTRVVPRLYEFYKRVLRLAAKDAREYWKGNNINRYVEVPTQGAVLSFSYKADVNNDTSNILLEFGTPLNLDGEYERVKALGVKMKENSKNKNEFKCYDPDGNMINVFHYCLNFYRQIPNSD